MDQDIQKACRIGNISVIKIVVEGNPDKINEIDEKLGWTPLYRTVICSHADATAFLLESGADPNIKNRMGESPLHQAADNREYAIVQMLLSHKADPNIQTNEGDTPLHHAAFRGDRRMMNLLLKKSANPNVPNFRYGRTPLHYAVDYERVKAVSMMMYYEADPNIIDCSGKSPLDLAKTPEMTQALTEPPKSARSSARPTEDFSRPTSACVSNATQETTCSPDQIPDIIIPKIEDTPVSVQSEEDAAQPMEIPEITIEDKTFIKASPVSVQSADEPTEALPGPAELEDQLAEIEALNANIRAIVKASSDVAPVPIVTPEPANYEAMPSPDRVVNPALRSFLISIKLEELLYTFIDGGYDDLDLMVQQMRSREPLTDSILADIGIKKPGHRSRLLAHFEEASISKWTTRRREKKKTAAPVPEIVERNQLEDWLIGMNIAELLPNFMESGYDDLDEIYYLMGTNYAMTDRVLEESIGVSKPGFRTRILLNVQNYITQQETSREKESVQFEKEDKKFACEMCILM